MGPIDTDVDLNKELRNEINNLQQEVRKKDEKIKYLERMLGDNEKKDLDEVINIKH